MLRSMTGFGHCEYMEKDISFSIEIKTVNHRYSDVFLRMPKQISSFEDRVRNLISKRIQRGKIDIYITYDNKSADALEVLLDEKLAKAYADALKKIAENLGLRDDISVSSLARFPDILRLEKKDSDEAVGQVLEKAVTKALDVLLEMREKEGARLKESLLELLNEIEVYVKRVSLRAPLVVKEYKEKMEARISELVELHHLDPIRLATEVALFADKCSVDEELVRLGSHVIQMREMLEAGSPVGKKADFLIQEMNREVNTIGSKASDLEITRCVVELKSEIEKLREQIQNIE